jgi:general secretion pathway protein H
MSRAGAAEAGFTLIEILAVLLLMGLLTMMVAPRFAAWREPGLRDVARNVVAELRARRTDALRTGRPVLATAASLHVPPGFAVVPEGVQESLLGPPGITFLPDGRSGGGSLLLAGGADQVRVGVDWLTGEVRLFP